jgi:hypothetical protein
MFGSTLKVGNNPLGQLGAAGHGMAESGGEGTV